MTPERWATVEKLYHAALGKGSAERGPFLAEMCAGDDALRREVESLLEHDGGAAFLSTPAVAPVGHVMPSGSSFIGQAVGSYLISGRLGAGGMGEVYRARDQKLGRDVAIKVLPEPFAADAERVARFLREAQILAALNHPHIAAIYGLEEAHGSRVLILELVEGGTLAKRLTSGAMPVPEAINVARQVADALQAAHEKGIIHRDLKPANIALTHDGQVKVLDFGLAKSMEPTIAGGLSESPTLALASTEAGVILGTAAYMSPEQAKGRPADRRSDVWGLGCVLYEMLTGRRPFRGEDLAETLAAVMMKEPDWTALPAGVTPAVRTLLQRALEKDRARRITDVGAFQFVLNEPAIAVSSTTRRRPLLPFLMGASAVIALVALAAAAYVSRRTRDVVPQPLTRLTIVTGAHPLSVNGIVRDLAISPDGKRVVWIGNNGTQLVVRALDQLEPTLIPVPGANPRGMFFSPDGQSLGVFDAGGYLRITPVSGGPAVSVTKADGLPLGASWGSDGAIVFATQNATTGLQRVASTGGAAAVLTRPNRARGEADHRWPQVLPGADAILFTIAPLSGGLDMSQVAVLSLKTGTQKIVLQGASDARYVSAGYLVYAGPTGAIWAVGFNVDTMEATGNPVRVLAEAPLSTFGAADFDVAENGTLVYVRGGGQAVGRTLVWVDRNGTEEVTNIPPRAYLNPRLSPDGARVAIESRDGDGDIWIWDFARHTLRNLTLHPAADRYPVWTPDGTRIVYTSDRDGVLNLYWQAVDGSGTPERLTTSPNPQSPTAVSADGSRVVFHESGRSADLMTVTLGPDHEVRGLLQTASNELNGTLSSDGRWLAYQSNEANQIGQFEIHVRPLGDVNSGHWQVTTGGGVRTTWSRDDRELYYLTLKGTLMRIPIESGPVFTPGPPTRVVEGDYYFGVAGSPRTYDVSADRLRYLMIKPVNETSTPASLVVVQRWIDELKRAVPMR